MRALVVDGDRNGKTVVQLFVEGQSEDKKIIAGTSTFPTASPDSLRVGPNGTGEVIVRATSPARSFKAFGECQKK